MYISNKLMVFSMKVMFAAHYSCEQKLLHVQLWVTVVMQCSGMRMYWGT